jgi:membrane-bound inhibitor of C-type lysozyme
MQFETRHGSLALVLIATLSLAACQRAAEPPATVETAPPPTTTEPAPTVLPDDGLPDGVLHAYVWECDGDLTLNVRNLFREDAVTIALHEGERKLPLVVSASGAKYADDTITFWTKGNEATFERKGTPAVNCREVRAKSLLADARVRGVAYRGTGNEPGWMVEIGPATRLLFVTNFGEERHEFGDASTPGADSSGVTVFTARHGNEEITVTVAREACIDDMSGAEFDHRMVVEFAGQSLRGCAAAVQ